MFYHGYNDRLRYTRKVFLDSTFDVGDKQAIFVKAYATVLGIAGNGGVEIKILSLR